MRRIWPVPTKKQKIKKNKKNPAYVELDKEHEVMLAWQTAALTFLA